MAPVKIERRYGISTRTQRRRGSSAGRQGRSPRGPVPAVNRRKRFRRTATRDDTLAASYPATITVAMIPEWV